LVLLNQTIAMIVHAWPQLNALHAGTLQYDRFRWWLGLILFFFGSTFNSCEE